MSTILRWRARRDDGEIGRDTNGGWQRAKEIMRDGEFLRLIELQREFIRQIDDDVLREEMGSALKRMEGLGP